MVAPSSAFRAHVASGFVVANDRVMLRKAGGTEIYVAQYLDADPSRRPVDLAASSLAFARHVACELRRLPLPTCRIVVMQGRVRRDSTVRFDAVPAVDWLLPDLEAYNDAVLTLDS